MGLHCSRPPRPPRGPGRDGIERTAPPWCDLLSLAVVLPLLIPIFMPGWFIGHDLYHPVRLFEQDLMIRNGHFPVRWYPDVSAGYGSAHPTYYAPLFYLIAQLFHSAGFSVEFALKLALAVVLLASAWAMYRLVSRWLGPGPGLVAAAAVTWAPYHLVDLYVRAAFSELTVFATLPLTMVAFERLGRSPDRRSTALAGLAFAGLLLSHTITTMVAPALLVLWVALLSLSPQYRAGGWFRHAGAAAGLGIGLAAFFLIPLALERGHIDVGGYSRGYFSWDRHFVSPLQLLWSSWGFGLSVEGPNDGMSFRLGLPHLLGLLAGLVIWFRVRRSAGAARSLLWWAVICILAIFLVLPVSSPLWNQVGPLQLFQFPWRFLLFPAVGMSAFLGLVAFYLEGRRSLDDGVPPRGGWPGWVSAVIAAALVAGGLPLLGVKERVPAAVAHTLRVADQSTPPPADSSWARAVLSRDFIRATSHRWIDHLPRGAHPRPTAEHGARPRFEVVSGPAEVEILEAGPVRYRARVAGTDTALVRLNVYRDPGWEVRLNDRPVELLTAERRPVHLVAVPPGRHEVEAFLTRTRPRWLGDGITLLCLVIAGGLSVPGKTLQRKDR